MEFIGLRKNRKKLFCITSKDNIKMAIEWNIIDNIAKVNWVTLNDKLYELNDENIKNDFIVATIEYFKTTDKYKEIKDKYNK